MTGKQIDKWADEFMFTAEKSNAAEGPKAFLLQGTPDPLGSIAAFAKMYKGEVVRDKSEVTDEERRYYLAEMQKTKLKAPLEAVNLHWMIEGVTRSYTHQMVRQRTAVYAQESLRFAVKEDAAEAVALPPSLAGTLSIGDWLNEHWPDEEVPAYDSEEVLDHIMRYATEPQKARYIWELEVQNISESYNTLVNSGIPAEDARGLLPHNITTRLNYATNLRNYQDHAGNRLCTQAQFEWRMVWVRMLEAMRDYCTTPGCKIGGGHGTGVRKCDNWQWVAISELFRPVCYYTGKCEFGAEFDRKCSIRGRVQANAEIGRPSSEWAEEYSQEDVAPNYRVDVLRNEDVRPLAPGEQSRLVFIGNIQPAEWLLDAGAAR